MNTKKNTTLELFKLFASYMVVFIHVVFYGNLGIVMDALARFAVPLFFLTSGFFSYNISPEKIKKRIKHIFSLLLFATVIYIIFDISSLLFSGNLNKIPTYFSGFLNLSTLLKLFIFNMPISGGHLWYLWAILYVYIIFYFAAILHIKERIIFIISFLLLFLHILLGECLTVFGISVPIVVIRNFALMGIPFFVLGLFANKHQDKLCNISNKVIITAIIAGVSESLLSRYLFGKNELYIGTLLILFAFVVIFLKYPNIKHLHFLDKLDGCSTYIYIFHLMISSIVVRVFEAINLPIPFPIVKSIRPLLVCVISTILAYIVMRIKKNSLKKQSKKIK